MACPVCKKRIDATQWASYVVGWCGQDVHTYPCLNTHIRKCTRCRFPNGDVIRHQDAEKDKLGVSPGHDQQPVHTEGQAEGRSGLINETRASSSSEFDSESEFDEEEGEFSPSSSEFD